jgi:hypothetical protein
VEVIYVIQEPPTITTSEFSKRTKDLTAHFSLSSFLHSPFTLCHHIFSAGMPIRLAHFTFVKIWYGGY